MPAYTAALGVALVLVGALGYFLSDSRSVTALIPSGFGAVFLVLAAAARGAARKHVMHAAVALALLLAIMTAYLTIQRLNPPQGEVRMVAVLANGATCLLCLLYVIAGVQSFMAARRARTVSP